MRESVFLLVLLQAFLSLGFDLLIEEEGKSDEPLSRVKRQFGGFQGGFFPQGQRFPQNQGNFPQGQGGFPQGQGNFQPGRFPQGQGGFQQAGFPQGQGGFQQGGFPQGQGGFQQGGFPQGQGGSQQGHFPQNQGGPQKFDVTTPQTFIRGPTGFVPANQATGNQGQNLNCRGHRRRRPECQNLQGGGNQGSSGNQGQNLNCRGNRRRRPECQNLQGGGSQGLNFNNRPPRIPNCRGHRRNRPECNVNTEPITDQKVIEAFESIAWLARLSTDNRSIGIPNLPDTPSAAAQSRNFLLAVGRPDVPFQSCATPRFEPGHCRYLQHCILPNFVQSFNIFLQYVCFIEGTYVGVCCPDSRYPTFTTTPPTTTTSTTSTPRPTTPPSDSRGCGLNSKEQVRIVGGRNADPQEWPWMAALLRDGTTQFCGGVLISNKHVLTAAHCTNGFDASRITVRLGEYIFDSTSTGHQDYKPLAIRQHSQYNTTTFVNDISILVLPQQVAFNDDIWPVCLPPPGPLYENEQATVTGWGTIYYGGPVATTLQEVTIPVWTNQDCDDTYEQTIVDTVLCAGAKQGGQDSCQGDSGGPLLLKPRVAGRWTVIGVVSWGIRCAEPGFPGVYTRVNRYLDWIRQNSI